MKKKTVKLLKHIATKVATRNGVLKRNYKTKKVISDGKTKNLMITDGFRYPEGSPVRIYKKLRDKYKKIGKHLKKDLLILWEKQAINNECIKRI